MTPNTQYQVAMVKTYVLEAQELTWGEALELAERRDRDAANHLEVSAETQLQMERAAQVANETVDELFQTVDWTLFTGAIH
jgi:hypothetical protein